MKKVILIPSNTDLNRGDQALVWESVRLIKDVYKDDVDILLMASGSDNEERWEQTRQTEMLGHRFLETILHHPGRNTKKTKEDSSHYSIMTLARWGGQAIVDWSKSSLLLSTLSILNKLGEGFLSNNQRRTIKEIKKADAIFVKGGGFIHSYGAVTDVYLIYYLLYQIRLALRYGKKVYVLPNSIGPLRNKFAKKMVVKTLRRCSLITLRENISLNFVKSLGVDAERYPDLGFYLKPTKNDFSKYLTSKGVNLKRKNVIITLRPYRFSGHQNPDLFYDKYKNSVVTFIEYICSKGYGVTFFAHTLGPSSHEDDRIALQEVFELLSDNIKSNITYIEDKELNCQDVEKIYSYYDFMIGTRFHSVIFSLNVGTPSIAIAYGGNKGKGIMEDLGNSDFSIDIDKLESDTLVTLFDNLELSKDIYLENLNTAKQEFEYKRDTLIKRIQLLEKV